jgi:hypothetical protein
LPHRADPWPDDAELVAYIVHGSTEHFNLFYKAYFPRIFRFALRRLRDPAEAEDVTSEILLTAYRSFPRFTLDMALLPWMFQITRDAVNRRLGGKGELDSPTSKELPGTPLRSRPFSQLMSFWALLIAGLWLCMAGLELQMCRAGTPGPKPCVIQGVAQPAPEEVRSKAPRL